MRHANRDVAGMRSAIFGTRQQGARKVDMRNIARTTATGVVKECREVKSGVGAAK